MELNEQGDSSPCQSGGQMEDTLSTLVSLQHRAETVLQTFDQISQRSVKLEEKFDLLLHKAKRDNLLFDLLKLLELRNIGHLTLFISTMKVLFQYLLKVYARFCLSKSSQKELHWKDISTALKTNNLDGQAFRFYLQIKLFGGFLKGSDKLDWLAAIGDSYRWASQMNMKQHHPAGCSSEHRPLDLEYFSLVHALEDIMDNKDVLDTLKHVIRYTMEKTNIGSGSPCSGQNGSKSTFTP